ncbi:MAG: hypothetical protein H7331_01795 [Bacteroidia bacterium]|nr:hypothetical protein [Bacteroidia bacterium]
MKNIKSLLIIASALLITLSFYSCKKNKKGTLEKLEFWTASGSKYYSAKVMADNPPAIKGQEYEDPSNSPSKSPNYYYYYWADKSPKDLGYTEGPHTDSDGKPMYYATSSGKTAGSNGHWGSGSSSSSSGSGACPEGTWKGTSCPNVPGSAILTLSSNKRGSFSNKDCKGICDPMVFTFNYSVSGSTIKFMYDAQQPIVKCTGYADSRPPKPADGSATFTCSGSSLTIKFGSTSNVYTK